MKINVYGSDLTAWTAAASLSQAGNEVCIIDLNSNNLPEPDSLQVLKNEPGLYELVFEMRNQSRLELATFEQQPNADVFWLAVRPSDKDNAFKVAEMISAQAHANILLVNQSNLGVGTTEKLQALLNSEDNQVAVYLPDYIQEGRAITSFATPKRITIGSDNDWGITMAKALTRPFCQRIQHIQIMSPNEAEFTKLAITGMLAIRLGYVNELANLADQMNVDIEVIHESMGADPRIGSHYLQPGCGFGGHNFYDYLAKFSDIFSQKGSPSLLKTVLEQNETQKELPFRKLWQYFSGNLKGKRVTLWGAAFKPGTASIDNAPSLKLISALLAQKVEVKVHDPLALENLENHFKDHPENNLLTTCSDPYDALSKSDALLLVTEWSEYWSPNYNLILKQMCYPLIIDGRNIYEKEVMSELGINYIGIGR